VPADVSGVSCCTGCNRRSVDEGGRGPLDSGPGPPDCEYRRPYLDIEDQLDELEVVPRATGVPVDEKRRRVRYNRQRAVLAAVAEELGIMSLLAPTRTPLRRILPPLPWRR
jgi:hypothetical protein